MGREGRKVVKFLGGGPPGGTRESILTSSHKIFESMGNKRRYIDQTAEDALLNYEYHGADHSYLSKAYTPFWNFVCTLLPDWMAPNLVTFISFCCCIVVFVTCVFTHPHFEMDTSHPIYPFMFVVFAFLIWAYQTLDAVDGKQARKTNSSSPLGELFDHGCDALNTSFQTALGCCMLGFGNSSASFLFFVGSCFTAHMCLFEEYTTLVLRFGKFNSVTEILALLEIFLVITGVTRGWLWKIEIGFLSNLFGETVTVAWFIALSSFVVIPLNMYEAIKYTLQELRNNTEQIQERGLTLTVCLFSLVSGVSSTIVYIIWFIMDKEFYRANVFLFCITYGTLLSYLSSRMIIHRVCKQKMKPFYLILVPLFAGFVVCNFVVESMEAKFYVYVGMLLVFCAIYLHFVYFTINEITDVLGIYLFSLKKRRKDL